MRPAEIRYYVDADTLGLAHIIAAIRPDVTYPGDPGAIVRKRQRPACPITSTDVPDETWIREVAARGWTIITRDRHIEQRPAERETVTDTGAKVFAITSPEILTVWHQLEIVMTRWRDIERLSEQPGPYIYSVTRTGLRRIL